MELYLDADKMQWTKAKCPICRTPRKILLGQSYVSLGHFKSRNIFAGHRSIRIHLHTHTAHANTVPIYLRIYSFASYSQRVRGHITRHSSCHRLNAKRISSDVRVHTPICHTKSKFVSHAANFLITFDVSPLLWLSFVDSRLLLRTMMFDHVDMSCRVNISVPINPTTSTTTSSTSMAFIWCVGSTSREMMTSPNESATYSVLCVLSMLACACDWMPLTMESRENCSDTRFIINFPQKMRLAWESKQLAAACALRR